MDFQPFGKIDIKNLEEYYHGDIQIHGNNVEIDLNFESESIEKSELDKIKQFINDIETIANRAFKEISKDFDLDEESETAKEYLQFHLEEFTEGEIIDIFGTIDIDKQTFLKQLKLQRIGLYPEDEESYAIFDIQLPEEYTNYLMAVTYDSVGQFLYISMES